MVFFTCNHCGESVKKPSVEKHYNTRCRGVSKNVSCMDCQTDFRNEEYVTHTKCITEAEKYSGKDYVPKESKNSGAKKQESWMDIIRSILESSEYNLNQQSRNAFQRLQSIDNVPRKKAKFQNFASNCMRLSKAQCEDVWKVLDRELEKMKEAKQAELAAAKAVQDNAKKENTTTELNGTKRVHSDQNGHDQPAKKKVKNSNSEENDAAVEASAVTVDANGETEDFQWNKVLKKLVAKHDDGIHMEKLRAKLIKKYTTKLGIDSLNEKQEKKFGKRFAKNLNKCSDLKVEGEVVKVC